MGARGSQGLGDGMGDLGDGLGTALPLAWLQQESRPRGGSALASRRQEKARFLLRLLQNDLSQVWCR